MATTLTRFARGGKHLTLYAPRKSYKRHRAYGGRDIAQTERDRGKHATTAYLRGLPLQHAFRLARRAARRRISGILDRIIAVRRR